MMKLFRTSRFKLFKMILRNSSDFSVAFIFIMCVGGTFCLNEHRDDIITDPTAVHCTKNPCMNGTCFVVSLPGTNENSEVECTGKSCFKYVFEKFTRENASAKCISLGGELASFDTSAKLELLKKSTRNGELHHNFAAVFWTSGKQSSNGAWSWGSEPINSILTSNLSQSGDESREACLQAAAEFQTSEGLIWIPVNCALESYYICEIDQSIILQERTYQCRCDGDSYGVNCTSKHTKQEPKEKITCEGDTMELECFNETLISVDKVLYGESTVSPIAYNCRNETDEQQREKYCKGSLNASLIISEMCHNRDFCKFTVNEETLGAIFSCHDGIPENKDYYAKVEYFCKDMKETQYRRSVSCEYDKDVEIPVYLSCQQMAIHIQYAYLGHMERYWYCGNAKEDFFEDDYKDGCSSLYFLEYLVKRCNGKNICSFVKDRELMRYRCEEPPNLGREVVFADVRYICVNPNKEPSGIDTYSRFQRKNCMERYDENLLHWPETIPGVEYVQSCPDGQSGSVTWMCTTTGGQWHEDGPDLSQCVPQWIDEYSMQIDASISPAGDIAKEIKMDFSSTEKVNVETVSQTVNLMERLIDLQTEQLNNVSDDHQKLNIVVGFQKELLAVASELLEEDVLMVLENGQEGESARAGTSISDEVEESAFLLADTLKYGTRIIKSDTIDMKVRTVDINDKSNDTKEDDEEHYVVSLESESSCSYLKLPRLTEKQTTTLLTMTDGPEEATEQSTVSVGTGFEFMATVETNSPGHTKEKLKIMFVEYKTLGKFLHSEVNDDINSMVNDNSTETHNGTVGSGITLNKTKLILDSNVIGASLRFGDHQFTEFEDNQTVEFCLTRLNTSLVGEPKCVYWNYSEITNTGKWLDNGCTTEDKNTHVVCICNHMTNFAILMDVHGVHIPVSHEDALGYITIIGCSISIVALLACIFVFSILKRLRSLRTIIHRNLCISLAASQFIFIVGVERTQNKVVCSIIAGVLHYSFLVSFMWMCLEGIHLYVTLVRVFNAENHGVLQYYLAAYAIPLVIVVALASSVPEGYGTDKYCWLSTENNFIWAFTAPVAVIILLNLVILVISLRKAYASSKAMKQEATKTQELRTWVKGAITLLFLLGSTWATGLFFCSRSTLFLAYIFTILNSLQGLFIFLFYCFNNDTVKKETKSWLSRKRWVPMKIRELLKETPKTTSMGNTLTSNVDQIETATKTEPSATIMCRYSDEYTISSLFNPASIDMVDYSMTSYTNQDVITSSGNMPPRT